MVPTGFWEIRALLEYSICRHRQTRLKLFSLLPLKLKVDYPASPNRHF
jgi:hypothetical protein